MEYNYPKFTPEMKKTHTILIPNMAITQFRLLEYALRYDGYKCEILGNCGSAVAQLGLKYVHNDTCYPALLVIGQFLDALNSGKYDLDHTALLITQTGGGCRASNYIHASVDPKTVQYLAGHESSKITMDIYAKVKYNRPDELVRSMSGAFASWEAV